MDIDAALLDKWIHTLRRVGRKNMTAEDLWRSWINED